MMKLLRPDAADASVTPDAEDTSSVRAKPKGFGKKKAKRKKRKGK